MKKTLTVEEYSKASGLSDAEIARRLGYSEQNLNGHKRRGACIVENSKGELFCVPERLRRAFL